MIEKAALATKTSENKGQVSRSTKPNENHSQSLDSPVEQILQMQQTTGNQAVQRLIESGTIQAKLNIGRPNDKYEQEADRVAEQVMRMTEPEGALVNGHWSLGEREKESALVKGHRTPGTQVTPLIQRHEEYEDGEEKNPEEEPEEIETLQTKNNLSFQPPDLYPDLEARINAGRGGGQPLPETTRTLFESRFGYEIMVPGILFVPT